MSHHCHAIAVCCIDFRFQKYIRKWTDENLKDQTFDLVGFAGSTKDLDTILNQIDISVRLHQISQVVLIHHEEYGAYGAECSLEKHTADLLKAKSAILSRYPHLDINLYYFKLSGEFTPVQ
jgi:carbonic anhydrase